MEVEATAVALRADAREVAAAADQEAAEGPRRIGDTEDHKREQGIERAGRVVGARMRHRRREKLSLLYEKCI